MKKLMLICIGLCAHLASIAMIDNAHFWRATRFFGEPRYEEAWLSSIDISTAGGSTSSSRNTCGKTTALLNLYGPHNFQKIGEGVPNKDPNNLLDTIVINLAAQPSSGNFGRMIYDGTYSIVDTTCMLTQNFFHGFFAQIQIPIRSMELSCIKRCDLSSIGGQHPNQTNVWWQAFLTNFDAILKRYCLEVSSFNRTSLGDTAVIIGWTKNHEETEVLDFIDLTVKTGILAPTGHIKDIHNPFDLATGYDGHWGVPVVFNTAFGLYEWLNIGAHLSALMFLDKKQTVPIKTNSQQNGFIKLARTQSDIQHGTVWHAGAYAKADHVAHGLSFLGGYSFARQDRSYIKPCRTDIFDTAIINSDETLHGFTMHTVHFGLEYDFTKQESMFGPRIGISYDMQIGGTRIFKTSMIGGQLGIDISWHI